MTDTTPIKTTYEAMQQKRAEKDKKRYDEIKHLRPKITYELRPKGRDVLFSGKLKGDEAQALSERDVALLVSWNELRLGWACVIAEDGSFSGHYTAK